jgi:L,D-transpeptidase-like protein
VKAKFVGYVSIATFIAFLISCTDLEKSSLDNTTPEVKEKPEVHLAKTKKAKKKILPTAKRKHETQSQESETPSEDDQSKEDESSAAPENSSITNLIARKLNNYAVENAYSTQYCFLVDMSIPSGKKRFFVYDLETNSVVYSGLCAHGSCNTQFLDRARFSNATNCGCSSLGKYKVGEFYRGKYGKSFRLYGLDNSNSNAYKRAIVIHGYDCVPDKEIYPMVLCNSLGCVMVSYNFFDKLSRLIEKSDKPIVLWMYQ